jgi:hypothetical protein
MTVLVLTGVSRRADLAGARTQPDLVLEGLPALQEALGGDGDGGR